MLYLHLDVYWQSRLSLLYISLAFRHQAVQTFQISNHLSLYKCHYSLAVVEFVHLLTLPKAIDCGTENGPLHSSPLLPQTLRTVHCQALALVGAVNSGFLAQKTARVAKGKTATTKQTVY